MSNPCIVADGDRAGFVSVKVVVRIMAKRPNDGLLGDIDIVTDCQRPPSPVEQDTPVDDAMVA
jgi:hypothetical protein